MTQEQAKIKIELDMNELNTVMAGLGKMPYEQVFLVIDSLRQQVGPQIQQQGGAGPGAEG